MSNQSNVAQGRYELHNQYDEDGVIMDPPIAMICDDGEDVAILHMTMRQAKELAESLLSMVNTVRLQCSK